MLSGGTFTDGLILAALAFIIAWLLTLAVVRVVYPNMGRIGVADRAGGRSDLRRAAAQPKALIPCAGVRGEGEAASENGFARAGGSGAGTRADRLGTRTNDAIARRHGREL